MDKAYIIDGSGYIFRAYYAVAPLSTSDGFPTNALYGFTRMLIKLLNDCDSPHVVMVFDAGRETFRNELYPEYKANRDECPEDLVPQMPFFRKIAEALGMTILEEPGYEADDVIATLADRLSKDGIETIVVSGDKDLMQLVDEHVSVWDTMKDRRFCREEVVEKFGVPPEKVVEFLGLTGDSSDNIPGVSGVGPKTAVQLIEKYGDVETILNSVDKIREDKDIRSRKKIAEVIESDPEIVRLSRKLVEVARDAPVHIRMKEETVDISTLDGAALYDALICNGPQEELLTGLVNKLGFQSLLKDFAFAGTSKADWKESVEYQTIYAEDLGSWLDTFNAQTSFSFDLETSSLDTLKAEIVGLAFCWSDTEAYYIPVAHMQAPDGRTQVPLEEFLAAVRDRFEDSSVKKIGQNLKYDVEVLARYEIAVRGVSFDTMIAGYLVNPDRSSRSLTSLAREFLGIAVIEYEDVVPKGSEFKDVSIEVASEYAAEDAHVAWLLAARLQEKIKELELTSVFQDIDMPLLPVLAAIEQRGILLDSDLLSHMSKELGSKMDDLKKQLFDLAGCEFNLNSPKQLGEILYDKLGIPTKGLKKTKTGVSTNAAVLEKLSVDYEFPALILEYRMLHKLKSTYVDALPAQVSPVTGRLHTKLNQTITATGRLSSSDPNLQNIPIQTAEGRRVREAFIAPQGKVLISADYSQIELRVLAHMSGDRNLIAAFQHDEDIHAATAREILGIGALLDVTPEERRIGKTINFGVIYGMSGFRLAGDLGIPVHVANEYIENYFDRYSSVRKLFARFEQESQDKGYVCTMFGRKRFIEGIDTTGRGRGFLQRAAINAPIQGTAADIMKLAMIALEEKLPQHIESCRMLLQIHDELLFEVDEDHAGEATKFVTLEMENVVSLDVPLKVDAGSGQHWQAAHA